MRVYAPLALCVWLAACDWSPTAPGQPDPTPDVPVTTDPTTDPSTDDTPVVDTDPPVVPDNGQDQTVETTAAVPEAPDQQTPVAPPPRVRPFHAILGERVDGEVVVLDDARLVAYVADAEAGAVLRVDLVGRTMTSTPVGAEPTRIARIGRDLFVTLRGSGELLRLTDDGASLREVDRVTLGAEPFDVAVSHNNDNLYVTLSQEDAVVAVDATSLEVVGRWSVPGEPKGIVSAPQGSLERVWVATARWSRVREITPVTGQLRTLALPTLPRFQSPTCVPRTLRARITGDLVLTHQNGTPTLDLFVPTLYADTLIDEDPRNVRPGLPDAQGMPGGDGNCDADNGMPGTRSSLGGGTGRSGGTGFVVFDGDSPPSSPYGQPADPDSPGKVGRFTPTVVHISVGQGDPGFALELGTATLDPLDSTLVTTMRSAATSIVADGRTLWAVSPGMGALTLLQPDQVTGVDLVSTDPLAPGVPLLLNAQRASFPVGAGALGVAAGSPEGVVVWSFLDREVLLVSPGEFTRSFGAAFPMRAPTVTRIEAPESALPLDVQAGRRLFWSAATSGMSAPGSGASCETCHAEGRNDGFTWRFEDMPKQSISLVGQVSATAPVTWRGDVATVAEEVHATSTTRMGGSGLSPSLEAAVVAYVDSLRLPVAPALDAAAVARGKAVFERPDVACVTCHVAGSGSDGDTHRVAFMPMATNTPALHGVGGSAPYFHDGSAATLADVVERSRDGSMGDTGGLTAAERADLVVYLRSL